MNSGIYRITHKDTGRMYIGQSIQLRVREAQYRNSGGGGRTTSVIKRAILKHGWGEFKFEILVLATGKDYLNELEQKAIASFDCLCPKGFNLEVGGGDYTVHPQTRQRISAANKGRKRTDKTKAKLAKIVKDRISTMTPEDKRTRYERSIGRSNANKVVSEETRQKMSETCRINAASNPSGQARFKGKKHSEEFCKMISTVNKEHAKRRWVDPIQREKLITAIRFGWAARKARLIQSVLEN